ncbi:MbcA/ParS/Xre antitoxin family protein [Hoeflea ulvae]|uniref:MbcA/ParS/Xre antitoxin family protein n=1 Tax=Hoeflea ulvae TaxID=2983764 RepID=A0ABT3YDG1_9HYPH|nr:MbcA/ParS/Xre antitoxin family protein [Hoeflea ulvae]MCY0093916.1 MbcA/ParS/Xre antitoxin family protein [Hoeflea ulvae]
MSFPEPIRRNFSDQRINNLHTRKSDITVSPNIFFDVADSTVLRNENTGQNQVLTKAYAIKSLRIFGYSQPEIFKLILSKLPLTRSEQHNMRLKETEAERAFRLLRIHRQAVRVFGSEENTKRWLRKPCRALDGAIPLDLLASETGAHIVESELHAIDHGMFA